MKKLLLVLAVALAAVPAAGAGGWATVGLSSLPAGTAAGETWTVDLTVKQHGRTPLEGVTPVVRVVGGDGPAREFAAQPTGTPGVYRAHVVFPGEGTWRYEVWDGFTQTHTYKPVQIGAPAGGSFPTVRVGVGATLVLGLVFVLAAIAVRRRDRGAPLPA